MERVIASAKGLGCTIVNLGANDITEGKKPYLILGLIWQLVRLDLLRQVAQIVKRGASTLDFLNGQGDMMPEEVLVRWVNFNLSNAGSSRRIKNFGSDISDSVAYIILLSQLEPVRATRAALAETDLLQRAHLFLETAEKCGNRKFINERDIVESNARLNLAFVAYLFNKYTAPRIKEPEPEKPAEIPAIDMAVHAVELLDRIEDEIDEKNFEVKKFQQEQKKIEAERELLEEEIEDLKDELQQVKNAPDIVVEKLKDAIADLEDNKDRLENENAKEIEELKKMLEQVQIENAAKGVGGSSVEAYEKAIQLERKTQEFEFQSALELKAERDKLREMAHKTQMQRTTQERMLELIESKLDKTKHKIKLEANRMNTRIDTAKTTTGQLQTDLTTVVQEVDVLEEKRIQLKDDVKALTKKYDEEKESRNRIAAVKRRLEKEVKKAERDLTKTQKETTRLERTTNKLDYRIEKTTDLISKARKTRLRLESDTMDKLEEKEIVKEELDETKTEAQKLATTAAQLSTRVSQLEDDYEEARIRGEEQVDTTRKKHQEEISKLKSRLAEKKAAIQKEVSHLALETGKIMGEVESQNLINLEKQRQADHAAVLARQQEADIRFERIAVEEKAKEAKRLEKELKLASTELEAVKTEAMTAQIEAEDAIREAEETKAVVDKEEVEALGNERQISKVRREADIARDLAKMKAERARKLAMKTADLESKVLSVQEQIEMDAQSAQDRLEVEEALAKRKAEDEKERLLREKRRDEVRNEELKKQARLAQNSVVAASDQRTQLEDEAWKAKRREKQLETGLETASKERDDAEKTRRRLERELRKAQNMIENERSAAAAAEQKAGELRRNRSDQKDRVSKTRERRKKADEDADTLRKELEENKSSRSGEIESEQKKADTVRRTAEEEAAALRRKIEQEEGERRQQLLENAQAELIKIEHDTKLSKEGAVNRTLELEVTNFVFEFRTSFVNY
jgi:hypothetical protein